jgi:hypothetical protein
MHANMWEGLEIIHKKKLFFFMSLLINIEIESEACSELLPVIRYQLAIMQVD